MTDISVWGFFFIEIVIYLTYSDKDKFLLIQRKLLIFTLYTEICVELNLNSMVFVLLILWIAQSDFNFLNTILQLLKRIFHHSSAINLWKFNKLLLCSLFLLYKKWAFNFYYINLERIGINLNACSPPDT